MGKAGRFRQRYEERIFWRGASDFEQYDLLVDGPYAPKEIKEFHSAEYSILKDYINSFSKYNEKYCLIEEGCGPGRLIRQLIFDIYTKKATFQNSPIFYVGIDFEINMIKSGIDHLVGQTKSIRGQHFTPISSRIASVSNEDNDSIEEWLRKNVIFIKANMSNDHIISRDISPLVMLTFGTLGNIKDTEDVIRTIYGVCANGGRLFISVFNRDKYLVGLKRYRNLSKKGFHLLSKTKYNEYRGEFTSEDHFYSKWYTEEDLLRALNVDFKIDSEVHHFSKDVGLCAYMKPKPLDYRTDVEHKSALRRKSKVLQKLDDGLHLLCPKCGYTLKSGKLPLASKETLRCSYRNEHKFRVLKHKEFFIPILDWR